MTLTRVSLPRQNHPPRFGEGPNTPSTKPVELSSALAPAQSAPIASKPATGTLKPKATQQPASAGSAFEAKATFEALDRIFKEAGLAGFVTGYHIAAQIANPQRVLLKVRIWDNRPVILTLPQFFKTMRTIEKRHQRVKALKQQFREALHAKKSELPANLDFQMELHPPASEADDFSGTGFDNL